MRWIRFAILILLAAIIQDGMDQSLMYRPNLLIIALAFFASHCNSFDAIICCFCIGLLYDLIGDVPGPGTLVFGIIGSIYANLNKYIIIKKIPYQAIYIFVMSIIISLGLHYLCLLKNAPVEPLKLVIGSALFSAIIGPFLFLPTEWWTHTSPSQQKRF